MTALALVVEEVEVHANDADPFKRSKALDLCVAPPRGTLLPLLGDATTVTATTAPALLRYPLQFAIFGVQIEVARFFFVIMCSLPS